jgi:transcription antitermination factor NusG
MELSWYAVYTKPNKELKVATILNKKGINHFFPVINTIKGRNGSKRVTIEPLINNHVFVKVAASEIRMINNIPGVISILFWKSKPAVIKENEIDAMRRLVSSYNNIKIEKTAVDVLADASVEEDPLLLFNEKSVSVKYQTVRVSLPSLGYCITAQREKSSLTKEKELVYEEPRLLAGFPKRFNAFFFN